MLSVSELTIIIVTRGRVGLLRRALISLQQQRDVKFHVSIVVDDCAPTCALLRDLPPLGGAICSSEWMFAKRSIREQSGPKRLAKLRGWAVSQTKTPWCSFLDDDNELEIDHFSTLLDEGKNHAPPPLAIHSWRSLWNSDRSPHVLKDRHPWCRDPKLARSMFQNYQAAGIYRVNSNIVSDQVVPYRRDISMVDTSEWLFQTAFLRELGFDVEYSYNDWLMSRTEDSKLLDKIVALGISVPSTRKPTLRYYLGGYSNAWNADGAQSAGWF